MNLGLIRLKFTGFDGKPGHDWSPGSVEGVIDRVRFSNFRVLRDVTVDLEPFTVFVGPNGSGKTTVLQGLLDLRAVSQLALSPLMSSQSIVSRITVDGSSDVVRADEDGAMRFDDSLFRVRERGDLFKAWVATVNKVELLQLNGEALRSSSAHVRPEQRLEPTGDGLAAALADFILTKRRKVDDLTQMLRQIVPNVLEVQAIRDGNDSTNPAYRVGIEYSGVGTVDAEHISEGTLMALAVLLSIVSNPPSILLIDDLDKGLHPAAQAEMISILRSALRAQNHMQIVATTHSPYLLDCFDPSEVRVMSLGDDGFAQCRKLTEHPHFADWEGALKAGEMWASVGEDWISRLPQPA